MANNNYFIIPGTSIRVYEGDIIKISNQPTVEWIVHNGWYVYSGVQNYGWYFVSTLTTEILPANVVDLTLCTLVSIRTIGSEKCDGKEVNYTRPFTDADAEDLKRTFITVDTLVQRDNLDPKLLIDGKLVRVNDNGAGITEYFTWDSTDNTWVSTEFGGTVSSIKIETTSPIAIDDDSAITISGVRIISHEDSGVSEGSYGDESAQTPEFGDSFKVPYISVDAKGHITEANEHTVTLPDVQNLKRQVHDAVVEELEDHGAEDTGYDNTESGLEATNVQDAIDELASATPEDVYTKEESDETFATKTALEEVADAVDDKASIDDTEASASKTYSSNKIDSEIKPISDTVGLVKTISGTASAVSVNTPYEIKNGKKYIVNLTSGAIRLSTTKNGTVVDYILGSSSPDSAVRAPYKTEFTATGDADSLRVPYPTVPYSFTITPKDGLYNTVEELYENIDVGYIQTFTESGASYASRQVDIQQDVTYIVNLTQGTLRLSTRATENGADIDWIFGSSDAGSAVTAPAKVKFTATGDAGYLRVRADSACLFTVEACNTTRGRFDLLDFDQVFSLSKYREDIYCPYPQLPANTDPESDFDAESITAQDIYDYFDALVAKYPQLLSKTVMGKDASNTYDVNRYVFADSTRSDYYATIYIGANEHGPQSDPREPAIVVARLFKDLCEGNAKTQRFLNLIKKYYKIVCIPVINPWGFNKSDGGRNNANNVNINRNYPTPAWSTIADVDKGAAPASEVETQYVINTISSFAPQICLDLHCLGYTNSANDMKCHYSGLIKDKFKIKEIQNLMKRDYNLDCTSYGNGDPYTYANGSAYFRYIGVDGLLLEFQARDGVTGGLNTVQHDAFILEADYTYMLRILNYLLSVNNPDLDTMKF